MSSETKNNINRPLVSVAVAVYNGEERIIRQIESILNQTYKNIEIIICDDSESDCIYIKIKEHFINDNIHYYKNEQRLGVAANFEKVISLSKGDYIALSDQDDVWLENRIEETLDSLLKLENRYGSSMPCLVFSDLIVCRDDLSVISDSFWKTTRIYPEDASFQKLLFTNVVTGCTTIFNRALFNIAYPFPAGNFLHDHWLALVASAFGKIDYCRIPLVKYVQHDSNVIGVVSFSLYKQLRHLCKQVLRVLLFKKAQLANPFSNCLEITRIFNERYRDCLGGKEREIIDNLFCLLQNMGIKSASELLKNHINSPSVFFSLHIYLFHIFMKRS